MAVQVCGRRFALPAEVVEDIGFSLLASDPLDSMAAIVPLLQTSKEWCATLSPKSTTTLYARLCRFKFDVAAVERRAFAPNSADLTAHLIEACRTLQCFRNGDIYREDVDSALLNALVMMYHDDGRNRSQLESSGIIAFVDRFLRRRLHESKETNEMWPLENVRNAAALWLSWLFTTKEQLESETDQQRTEFMSLVLPFLICPMRYASAYAPSNHFILPLTEEVPVFETLHGPFPVYHMKQQRPTVIPFFHSKTSVLIPPVSAAATLLFWSRREIRPFFQIPSGMPRNRATLGGNPGLTREDLVEFNSFKAAKLRDVVHWDWDWDRPVSYIGDKPGQQRAEGPSKQWDLDWWRIRMCQNVFWKQPRWRLGNVYKRGLLSGLWQGVYFLSNADSFTEVLRSASCPDAVSGAFQLLPRPILMRLEEHSFVRSPPISQANSTPRTSSRAPRQPCAIPSTYTALGTNGSSIEDLEACVPCDSSINNAWIPGPIGGLKWNADSAHPSIRGYDFSASHTARNESVSAMSSITFEIPPGAACSANVASGDDPLPTSHGCQAFAEYNGNYLYETFNPAKESLHQRSNASQREVYCRYAQSSSSRGQPSKAECSRCSDRQAYLEEVRQRGDGGESKIPEPVVDDEVEGLFKNIGMGRRSGDGSFDLNLSPSTPPNDKFRASHDLLPNRVEACDDGVEDTVVTGGLSERHRLAWGDSVYYGRVRPWDGMVAILRQHGPNDMRNHGKFLFYGYIYGGDTFVGNWRYAGGDPLTPAFEAPFIMSKRAEGPLDAAPSW